MKRICLFDAKPYDKIYFEQCKDRFNFEFEYFETKLNSRTAILTRDYDAPVAFVNDEIDADTINSLYDNGIRILAMRCAGYNNVDVLAAMGKIKLVRVPNYSPYAVAEHTMAILLTLVRKTNKAYIRTRDYNFSLNGLMGFDLHGKTVGIVGTGQIGNVFIDICKGFGLNVCAYDLYPSRDDVEYVSFEELCRRSDIISLHCPLTKETRHMINMDTIRIMKDGVYIVNTSRGALIDSVDLLSAIKAEKIGGAALDVYEEESELFYEDNSNTIIQDDILSRLITMPNVLVTSHQAFLTKEALNAIAITTCENLEEFFNGRPLTNEILLPKKSFD
ncbi:MAG TPA: 2-hydroxyacid dehydrogenase [Clostridia bacterium]|nr:2-hydroxyacid dehydrogenase [Clostridia bacterium]